jgi:ParB family chromosome partitioning protein
MASTRSALREITANVNESMGVRQFDPNPQLSPVASAKDVGRTPLRKFGRLSIEQIEGDPKQPRGNFDEEEIQRLASSIQKTGQLHPLRVRWDEPRGKWIIVTGERRYRATAAAGLKEIDCYFHDGEITESEILEQQLVENLLRQDLKPLEEARGYAALMELNDWNGKQVAEALRVSPSKVSRALALLDLPEDVQKRVEAGAIPRTYAYELTKLGNETTQRDLAIDTDSGALTTHKQVAKAVRQRQGRKASKARGIRQVFQAENGIKVTVSANRNGNYHEIEEALLQALDEVRLRIDNNVQIY